MLLIVVMKFRYSGEGYEISEMYLEDEFNSAYIEDSGSIRLN
jgi:hypothetical protein